MSQPHSQRQIRIGLVGTFEVANFGDCMFPVVYRRLLAQRLPDCEFRYFSPRAAERSPLADYGPVRPLPARLEDASFDVDVLIQCGGETLSLGHSSGTYNFPASSLSAFARMWLAPTLAASRGETLFFVHSVGMPTINLAPQPLIAKGLEYANKVSVRDAVTSDRLGQKFPVEADPMFALSDCLDREVFEQKARAVLPQAFEPNGYVCAHISAPYLADGIEPWCEQILQITSQTGLKVLLLPVCHFLWDRETLASARQILIARGMAPENVQLPLPGHADVDATAALIGMSGGVVSSSLHALVTAVSFGVPFAGYGGKGKSAGKHRQTLLAAGIDFGVVTDVSQLAATLGEVRKQDLEAVREEAIGRALSGFDRLVASISEGEREARPMPADLIECLVEQDRAPTRHLGQEAKRLILRMLKSVPAIAAALETRHRAKLLKIVSK
ncbi:polysaccharide pyruvyl transferase family protein [Qipengyuania nanhaisediminis]|uniref:polysaccharide pyruvyl transferase family protein n=1 Tax=Qipengyuania nanhaisediminis TaxID=604088 RepID=UPI0038B3F72C